MSDWRCNAEAERCLIGAALLGAVPYPREVDAAEFGLPAHARLWQAVSECSAKGVVDPVLVKTELGKDLRTVGGQEYLAACMEAVPNPRNWRRYAAIVRQEAAARCMQASLAGMQAQLAGGALPGDVAAGADALRALLPASDHALTSIASLGLPGGESGVPTPWPTLTRASGSGAGFIKGQMSLIAGYQKAGKTIAGTMACRDAAKMGGIENFHVVYATFADLSPSRLLARMLRQEIGKSWPATTEDQVALQQLQALPIQFYDGVRSGRSVQDMAAAIRRRAQELPIGCVIADYAQVMSCNGAKTPYERVEGVAYECALLAADMGIPVIVLSQVSGQIKGGSSSDIITKGGRGLEEHAGLVARLMVSESEGTIHRQVDAPFNRFGPPATFDVWLDQDRLLLRELQV